MSQEKVERVTIPQIQERVAQGGRFSSLTAYDATFAEVLDRNGVDIILVGDSLGMVVQGLETTLPVTMEHMIYHTRCVAAGTRRALLMADMPFLADRDPGLAVANAGRLVQAGAHCVKIEGGKSVCDTVSQIAQRGIPVCGHIGLQPQSVHKTGGYRVQGRERAVATKILNDAWCLAEAGIDLLLLECIPEDLANEIVTGVDMPVIGIGAGPACQGQVLVSYDMLGLTGGPYPRFVRNFLTGSASVDEAVAEYVAAVTDGSYPAKEHSY